ncbi:MAG: hypothetical protein ACTSQF_11850 [Candidatus Heimdallarchaeaceae archaeon]
MIQNIIITHESGLPLFGRSLMCHIGMHCTDFSKDNTFSDETLLNSALMNAMLIFDQAHPNNFHEFKMDQAKVLTFPKENITAIMYTDPDDNLEEYKNRLKLFTDLFTKQYAYLIADFAGDVSPFGAFQDIIAEEGLLEEGERFRKNCIDCTYDKHCAFRITAAAPNKTFQEIFDSIFPANIFKKMWLIFTGMFKPKYMPFY